MTKEEKIKILSTFCQKRYKCHDCPLNTETVKMCDSERSIFSTPQKYTEEELDKAGVLFAERDNRDFFNSYVDLGAEYDVVERPKHYTSTSIECIDAMRETQGDEAVKHFCECNAFKYLWRHNSKNGDEDVRKASWYLNKAVEIMGEEST
jgi:hypothetical protein